MTTKMIKKEFRAIARDNEVIIISDNNTYEKVLEYTVPNRTVLNEMEAIISNDMLIIKPTKDSYLTRFSWEEALIAEFICDVLKVDYEEDYANGTYRCWWYE